MAGSPPERPHPQTGPATRPVGSSRSAGSGRSSRPGGPAGPGGSGRSGAGASGRSGRSGRSGVALVSRLPIDPRFARRLSELRRQESRRRLRILAAVALTVLVVAGAAGSLYLPWLMSFRHVRVAAVGTVSQAQVLSVTGLGHPRPLIEIDTGSLAARLDAVADLGGARVRRSWPVTVVVEVTQRTPIATVARPATGSLAAGWATVDATGRVLADTAVPPLGLPVVQNAGPVPPTGQWLTGSAGPGVDPLPPAGSGATSGRSLVDLDAAPDSPAVPTGTAAALAVSAALPGSLRAMVQSVQAGPGSQLRLAVLPATIASGSIPVTLGDGSLLNQKLTALGALLTQGGLSGAAGINLTVPDRPAVAMLRS